MHNTDNKQTNKKIDQYEAEQLVASLQSQVAMTDSENSISENHSLNNSTEVFSWTLEQLASSSDGDIVGPVTEPESVRFNSISTDTRTLQPGALYIAIKGENFDGHSFVAEAVKQGAVAVLVSEDVETLVPVVEVEDTRIALAQFARWHRQQMPVKTLVAVTGSNGKTTIKTLLAQIFALAGNTLATEGNLNNDLGVPRTLLNLRPEHEYAVIEMGANHLHEIGYLTDLALPNIAIVNNASGAHLEGFGSLQGVIDTKGEIYRGLNQMAGSQAGVAIVNTDSAGYQDWMNSLKLLNVANIVQFGTAKQADIKVANCQFSETAQGDAGIGFDLKFAGEQHAINMPVLGCHNAMNAAACVAITRSAGIDWSLIKQGLQQFTGVGGRLQRNKISTGWLVDDSYNANPASVKAGIEALLALPGKAIVCLGAMAEIGEDSEKEHQAIAEFARDKGVNKLFVYGEAAKNMPLAFGENSVYFESHQQMAEQLVKELQAAETNNESMNVLVKGSRSARMELVSQQLLAAK